MFYTFTERIIDTPNTCVSVFNYGNQKSLQVLAVSSIKEFLDVKKEEYKGTYRQEYKGEETRTQWSVGVESS